MSDSVSPPQSWRRVRLGSVIADVQSGFACGERDPKGVIQLRMNNVDTRGNFVWDDFIRVPTDANTVAQYQLASGDVLFNNTNSAELVGKSALFTGYPEPVVFSNHFTRLRTHQDRLLPALLSAWLNHQWQLGVFERICNRWIGQSAVKPGKLLGMDLLLPPLPEQKIIVAILNDQMASMEQAKQAEDKRQEAASALLDAYLRSVFDANDAKAWPRKELLELCVKPGQYGTSQKSNDNGLGLPVLGMYHIHEGRIRWENVQHVDLEDGEVGKYLLRRGDLLFNRTNSAELVGKTAIYDLDKKAVFASYLIRFRLNTQNADPYFVSAYLNSRHGRDFIERNMARAIGQVNISASTMHKMPMPAPEVATQQRIGSMLRKRQDEIDEVKALLQAEGKAIGAMPTAILRKAFAGEL